MVSYHKFSRKFIQIKKGCLLVLVFTFVTWLIFSHYAKPFNWSIDEAAHYKVVQSYANLTWPIIPGEFTKSSPDLNRLLSLKFVSRGKAENINYSPQANHTPLYYWTAAVFYKIGTISPLNDSDGYKDYRFTRLASFLFFVIAIVFIYKSLSIYFSEFASLFMTFTATLQLTFITTAVSINNDIGADALAAIFFYYLIVFLKNRKSLNNKISILFGLLTGVAILVKLYNVILIPIFIVSFSYLNSRHLIKNIKHFFLYLISIFVLLLPWFLVNYVIYHKLIVDNIILSSIQEPLLTIGLKVLKDLLFSLLTLSGFSLTSIQHPDLIVGLYFLSTIALFLFSILSLFIKKEAYREIKVILVSSFIFTSLAFALRSFQVIALGHYYSGIGARYYLIFSVPATILITLGLQSIKLAKLEKLAVYAFGFNLFYFFVAFVIHY